MSESPTWYAQRTLSEVEAIITAPGSLHEMENRIIDGRVQRVYKRLWPSMRDFWLSIASEHADLTFVVFEGQRLTFRQALLRSIKTASMLRHVYGVQKGDRVGICARNSPDYLVAFWACHLIGAVTVLVNAWLPADVLRFCIVHTECKVIVLDAERADILEKIAGEIIAEAKSTGILVLNAHEGRKQWKGMKSWDVVVDAHNRDTRGIETGEGEVEIEPEDNSTILFTSGTTGLPKGVLSTQRMYLTNLLNSLVPAHRGALRRGEHILPISSTTPQKATLISVPLFHATGSTSRMMFAAFSGTKIVLMRKWVPEEAVSLIRKENIRSAGGVPSMAADLAETSLVGYGFESLSFGGAPPSDLLPARLRKAFPEAILSQGYGLTETNSLAVGISGEDYMTRPTSTGLPTPTNDLKIVSGDVEVPSGQIGEVWIRGPNVMKGYWRDPAATDKVITKDGWLKSGDIGYLDREGFLYIKDRIKDIIIRGGENIDSTTVENALYEDERLMEVAAVGVPHHRLGEVVAAVVSVKPSFKGQVSEASLVSVAEKRLPRYAVPVLIVIKNEPLEKNAAGKVVKAPLRKEAREIWGERGGLPRAKM